MDDTRSKRPADYENYALNKADIDRLLELRRSESFAAAFIVLANSGGNYDSTYVAHRDAEELHAGLQTVPFP